MEGAEKEGKSYAEWREKDMKGVCRIAVGACEIHKRSFAWQMVLLGLLGILGLGISQIIWTFQTAFSLVLCVWPFISVILHTWHSFPLIFFTDTVLARCCRVSPQSDHAESNLLMTHSQSSPTVLVKRVFVCVCRSPSPCHLPLPDALECSVWVYHAHSHWLSYLTWIRIHVETIFDLMCLWQLKRCSNIDGDDGADSAPPPLFLLRMLSKMSETKSSTLWFHNFCHHCVFIVLNLRPKLKKIHLDEGKLQILTSDIRYFNKFYIQLSTIVDILRFQCSINLILYWSTVLMSLYIADRLLSKAFNPQLLHWAVKWTTECWGKMSWGVFK